MIQHQTDFEMKFIISVEKKFMKVFRRVFQLPVSDTHLYKQFGNTVPINVVELIAKEIKVVLELTAQ